MYIYSLVGESEGKNYDPLVRQNPLRSSSLHVYIPTLTRTSLIRSNYFFASVRPQHYYIYIFTYTFIRIVLCVYVRPRTEHNMYTCCSYRCVSYVHVAAEGAFITRLNENVKKLKKKTKPRRGKYVDDVVII